MRRDRPTAATTHRITRTLACTVVYLMALGAVATPAWATADTGYQYKLDVTLFNGQAINACGRAVIADIADNRSWAGARNSSGTGCSSTVSVPPGYLGAQAQGYRDGSFCGQTSRVFSNVSTSSFGIGGVVCSNPSGLQAFKTVGWAYFYLGQQADEGYIGRSTTTPNQSY